MGAARIAILAVAAIAAIALAVMVRGMMAPKPPPPQVVAAAPVEKPMTRVLVAKRDLAIGTRLTADDMKWQDWPAESIAPTFITDGGPAAVRPKGVEKVAQTVGQTATDLVVGGGPMDGFDGAIVKEAFIVGEPMTQRKVVRGGNGGFLSVVLQPGMRAISVPVTSETAAGGFILPGDRVDVMQSHNDEATKAIVTEVLMQNVRVLAIDQSTEPGKDSKTIVGAVATLEVPAGDAEVLVRGKAQGDMMLVLRAYSDIGGGPGRGRGASDGATVRIIRAGVASEVSVR